MILGRFRSSILLKTHPHTGVRRPGALHYYYLLLVGVASSLRLGLSYFCITVLTVVGEKPDKALSGIVGARGDAV